MVVIKKRQDMCAASFGNKLNFLITLLERVGWFILNYRRDRRVLWNLFLNNLTKAILFSKSPRFLSCLSLDRISENIERSLISTSSCEMIIILENRNTLCFYRGRGTKFKIFSTNIENATKAWFSKKGITLILDRVHPLFHAIVFDE